MILAARREQGKRLFDDAVRAVEWIGETMHPRYAPADEIDRFGPIFWMDVQWALFPTGDR